MAGRDPALVAAALVREHNPVKLHDLSKVNRAFVIAIGLVAEAIFAFDLAGLNLR